MSSNSNQQILTEEEEKTYELIDSRFEKDAETYQKVIDLGIEVLQDPNSKVPHLPAFHCFRKKEEEIKRLDSYLPKLFAARTEEFCLEQCEKKGSSCLNICKEFANNAFNSGASLFWGLHKTYNLEDFDL